MIKTSNSIITTCGIRALCKSVMGVSTSGNEVSDKPEETLFSFTIVIPIMSTNPYSLVSFKKRTIVNYLR